MRKKIVLLSERNYRKKHHVSYDTILGMENAFAEDKHASIYCMSRIIAFVNKISNRFFNRRIPDISLWHYKQNKFFYASMCIYDLQRNKETLSYLVRKGNTVCIYCFDTWETQYSDWMNLFDYIRPDVIFLAYKQSYEYFKEYYSNVFWLPQSMDELYFKDYGKVKTRLFMQMGRKNEKIHNMILEYMKEHKIDNTSDNYVFECKKGNIIFPRTVDLALNMNQTKYFVCAPAILENRELTGNVADVTARYYEAMATKSLIIGYKPKEVFDELFPKDSMVDLENTTLEETIDYYENNPDVYWKKVEENYNFVMNHHTWSNRLEQIFMVLETLNNFQK